MAVTSFEVSTYDVRLARQLETQADGHLVRFNASITCRGSEYTLQIYFLTDSSFVPNNAYYPNQKRGTMFLPQDQFSRYIDLLRNEAPLYCFLSSSYPNQIGIYSGSEQVGEAE